MKELLQLAEDELGLSFGEPVEASEPENRYDGQQLTEKLKALLPEGERDPVCGQESDGKDGLFGVWNFERPLLKLASRRSVYAFAAQGADDAEWAGREEGEPLTVATAVEEARAEAAGGAERVPAVPGELTYPLTLELENFAGEAWDPSAEPVQLRVWFEPREELPDEGTITLDQAGESWTFTIQVPAAATKVHLEAEGFFLDAELEPPEALDHQKAALASLLPHRWRNVVLRRKSDMSLTAVEEAVRARFEHLADLQPYYRNLAWWAPGDAPAEGQPREVAVCGEGASLFGSDGLLPDAEGALDYVHPITGAWVLNTLLVAKKARLISSWDPYQGDGTSDEPVHFGWLAGEADPEALPYGADIKALAVLRSYAVGEAAPLVTFLIEREGVDPIEVGPMRAENGVVVAPAALAGWGGPWTLKIKGHEGASSEAPLPNQVTIARPEMGTVGPPERLKDGRYRWQIPFTAHAPERLEAWVTFRTAAVPVGEASEPSWEEACLAVPVQATRVVKEGGYDSRGLKFDATGEILTGARSSGTRLPDPRGSSRTDFFVASEFFGGAVKAKQVSYKLIKLLNHVRIKYARGLKVLSVAPDGLSAVVRDYGQATDEVAQALLDKASEALSALQGGAEAARWEGCEVAARADKKGVEARVPAPVTDGPGTLVAELDPAGALRALHAEALDALGDGEVLAVSFGLFAPNGGWFGEDYDEEVGRAVVPKDRAELDSASGGEIAGAWTDGPCAHLIKVSFGAFTFELGPSAVLVSVELCGGTYEDWKAAKPKLSIGGGDKGIVQKLKNDAGQGRDRAVSALLVASFPYSQLGGEKTFEAKTTAGKVVFAEIETTVPAAQERRDTTPRLEEAEVLAQGDTPGFIVAACQAPFVPPGKGVKVRVLKDGAEVEALAEAAEFTVANMGYNKSTKKSFKIDGSGCPDGNGRVEARFDRTTFAEHFPADGAQDFEVEFYRPDNWGAPSLQPAKTAQPETLEPEPLQSPDGADLGEKMQTE